MRLPGKDIGGCLYVHHRYAEDAIPGYQHARNQVGKFRFTVVKWNRRSDTISFIQSPDFDAADEPISGTRLVVRPHRPPRRIEQSADPCVFHHKWKMVPDNYRGFSVGRAKQRSLWWTSLPGIDRSVITRRSKWLAILAAAVAAHAADAA